MRNLAFIIFIISLILCAIGTTVVYHRTQQADINYYKGQRHFEKGDFDKAIRFYKESLSFNPRNPLALRELGYSYQWTKRYKEAIDAFNKALSLKPKDYKLKQALAETYSWMGKYKSAEDLYQEVYDELGSQSARRRLAEVYIWDKKPDKAKEILEDILKGDPDDSKAKFLLAKAMQYSGEAKEAALIYEVLLEEERPETKEELAEKKEMKKLLGQAYMISKDYEKAISRYREILKKNPKDIEARIAIADIFSWNKEYDKAIKEYEEVIKINPDNIAAKEKLATVYKWKKDYKKAEKLYKEVIRHDPKNLKAYASLGEIFTWQKKYRDAVYYLEIALSKKKEEDLLLLYGQALLYSQDYKEARVIFKRMLEENPENIDARVCLADTYAYTKNFKKAIKLYKETLDKKDSPLIKEKLADVMSWDKQYMASEKLYDEIIKETGSDKVRLQKARMLGWARKYQKALKEYKKLAKDTGDPLIELEMKAKKAYWNGRVKHAIAYYTELIKKDPTNVEALFDLSQIYSYQFMWQESVAEYKKILDISPNHFRAKEGLEKSELISKHLFFKTGYKFFEGDSPSRDVDIRTHSAFGKLRLPYRDKFKCDIDYNLGYRTFSDFNDLLENKARVKFEYRNNPYWWVNCFYAIFIYNRNLKAMHNFGGHFNIRAFDLGVSTLTYERERLYNNSIVIRDNYYMDKFKERVEFNVNERLTIAADCTFAHYRDDNYRYEPAFDMLYYLSLEPMKFSVKYRYFFREFKKKVPQYFSPKGFTTNIVEINWKHFLNKEEVFFGANDLYYDLKYEVRVDSETIVGHKFAGEINWDITKRWNISVRGTIVNSSANVYRDKSFEATVKYYF